MFFANGPVFQPTGDQRNMIMDKALDKSIVLGWYETVKTDKANKSFKEEKSFSAAIIAGTFGKGRIVLYGPHPEASGLVFQNTILSTVSWCSQIV